MGNNSVREFLIPPVRVVPAMVVLFVVGGGRALLGMVVGNPAHPITFLGMVAGAVGATAVVFYGTQAYGQTTSPTTRFFVGDARGFSDEADRDTACWVVTLAGVFAGGAYPTVFHGVLGLPGEYITHFFPAFATAAIWGVVLFSIAALTYLASGVLSLGSDSRDDFVTFAKLHALYIAIFGFIIGLSRILWYPLFSI